MRSIRFWTKAALAAARQQRGRSSPFPQASQAHPEARALALTLTAMHDAWFGSCGVIPYCGPALPAPAALDRPLALAAAGHEALRHLHPAQRVALDRRWATIRAGSEAGRDSIAYGQAVAARLLHRPAVEQAWAESVANDALPLAESGTAPLAGHALAAPRAGLLRRPRRVAAPAACAMPPAAPQGGESPPWAVLQATLTLLDGINPRRHPWATPEAKLEVLTAVAVAMADATAPDWQRQAMAARLGWPELGGATTSHVAAGFEALRRFLRRNAADRFADGEPDHMPVALPAPGTAGDRGPVRYHRSLWSAMLGGEAPAGAALPGPVRQGIAIGHGVARRRGFW